MSTWIALIRGINVGGKNRVSMKELVGIMESHDFANVRFYIQSGNLVFDSAVQPDDTLCQLIEKHFGFRPAVFILSPSTFRNAIKNNPFTATEGKQIHFYFCDTEPEYIDYELMDSLKTASERYFYTDKVFYFFAPEGIGRSKLAERIPKAFKGVSLTARNLNTIYKISEMLE